MGSLNEQLHKGQAYPGIAQGMVEGAASATRRLAKNLNRTPESVAPGAWVEQQPELGPYPIPQGLLRRNLARSGGKKRKLTRQQYAWMQAEQSLETRLARGALSGIDAIVERVLNRMGKLSPRQEKEFPNLLGPLKQRTSPEQDTDRSLSGTWLEQSTRKPDDDGFLR